MKNILLIFTGIALLACAGCANYEWSPFHKSVSGCAVVRDKTDSFEGAIKSEEVLDMLDVNDDNMYKGFQYYNTFISDADNEDIVLLQVKPEMPIFGTQTRRIRELKDFRKRVSDDVRRAQGVQGEKKQSRVIETVQKQFIMLGNIENCADRTLIIQSDGMQHTDSVSLYSPSFLNSIGGDPAKIAERYQALAPLPKVPGMRAYILHKPKDARAQRQFDLASKALSIWLTKYGHAKVTVAPNIVSID